MHHRLQIDSDSQSEKIAGDPGQANAVRHVLGSTDLLAGIAGKPVVDKTTVIASSHQITRLQITLIVGQRMRGPILQATLTGP